MVERAEQVALAEYCCLLETRETACGSKVNIPGTNFSESTDWSSMLMTPDLEFWMKAVRLEYDTLVRKGCWDIVAVWMCMTRQVQIAGVASGGERRRRFCRYRHFSTKL